MAINTELSVSGLGEFKSAFSQAQNAVKTLDAELKKNEAQYKNSGDKEAYLIEKQKLLQQQLKLQKSAAEQARAALKKLDANGVNPMSKSYQDLAQKLAKAETAILETTGALDQLKQGELEAASGADQLTTSVNGISKKISLDQVIGGIDRITGGLETAAKKAVDLGKQLFNTIMESARWADDTATMADMYGIPLDRFLRMQQLVTGGMDTSVDAMLAAQDKLKRGIGNDTDKIIGFLMDLGLAETVAGGKTDASYTRLVSDDEIDMFWRAGQALMNMSDAYDKEAAASALFGKSWKELVPLFTEYKSLEEYNAALDEQTVNSEDTVRSLAELNDAVSKLEGSWATLKNELLGELSPALKGGAEAISGLLNSLTEYMQTDEGKKMLADMGTAVSGLFEDLGKIDPGQVISGFTGVFNTITDGLKWLLQNKGALGDVLVGIVTAWAGARLTGGALQVLQLVNGVKDLAGGGGGGDGTTATTGGGSTTGGGGFWARAANTVALAGSAASFYRATEGNMKQQLKDFYAQTQGMSIEEQADLLWMQTTGMSPAEYNYRKNSDGGGEFFGTPENPVEVTVTPVAEDGSAQSVSDQVGTVDINGIVHIVGVDGAPLGVSGNWWGGDGTIVRPHRVGSHANGLPWVPYDGYLSVLHRGERVMTASENRQYTYNNNTYFGNVNLNNGLEVDALTESIARNNRRKNSGYGA
jgi:hypothetical protein